MSNNKFYYKDGTTSSVLDKSKILHRTDGPAAEWIIGVKYWFVDGKRHRIDGPAVEWDDGGKEWYIDNKFYSEQDFNKLIKEINKMSLSMKLTDPRSWVRELGENKVKLVG
jgi:hypothetical protein